MHILSIMNHKGGVGKTTTTLNVAAALHESGERVLLLDLDSQCSASFAMGLSRQELTSSPSTADVLFNDRDVIDTCYHNVWPGIDLVPASIDLAHAGLRLTSENEGLRKLARALSDRSITETYDTVLLDCPPAISSVTLNALMASTDLLIPTVPSYLSMQGLKSIGEVVSRTRSDYDNTLALSGIALTRIDRHRSMMEDATREIRNHYHRNVFETAIPEDQVVEEAQKRHQSLFTYAPGSKAARQYRALTGEITQRWANYDAVLGGIQRSTSASTVSSSLP